MFSLITWAITPDHGMYHLQCKLSLSLFSMFSQVINQLIVQRSRNEFLTMALEVELRLHHKTYHILSSLYTLLNKQCVQWQGRMVGNSLKLGYFNDTVKLWLLLWHWCHMYPHGCFTRSLSVIKFIHKLIKILVIFIHVFVEKVPVRNKITTL